MSKEKHLHDVILDVLRNTGKPLTVKEIQQKINDSDLWKRPKDGETPLNNQLSARINNNPQLFLKKGSLIYLANREKRIARLCWNTNNWQSPIEHNWKKEYQNSKSNKSFEQKYGYGHEEWLFNPLFKQDNFQYGFIQGLSDLENPDFIDELHLFTIEPSTKKRFYVGKISNVEILDYTKNNQYAISKLFASLLPHQIEELKLVKADYKKLMRSGNLPNIRFPAKKEYLHTSLTEINSKYFTNKYFRYQPFHITDEIEKIIASKSSEEKDTDEREFLFKPGRSNKSLANRKSHRRKKVVQSEPLHDKMQEFLYHHLVNLYGSENVGMENNTGLSTRIDVSLNSNEGVTLYEVKSYPSSMINIRIAIGQLLEYAYYPKPISCLKELIIVSQIPAQQLDIEYLKHIRKTTSLNIYYQSIDLDNKSISDKV